MLRDRYVTATLLLLDSCMPLYAGVSKLCYDDDPYMYLPYPLHAMITGANNSRISILTVHVSVLTSSEYVTVRQCSMPCD